MSLVGRSREVHATLFAAMRDGQQEGDLVGTFADWRNISVATPNYLSMLGFSQDITTQVKRRQWSQPFLEETFWEERCILNIRSSVLNHRGFKQVVDDFRPGRNWAEKTGAWTLDFVVDQQEDKKWTMLITMARAKYDDTWCKQFLKEFKALALQFACDPLQSIFHVQNQEQGE